MSIALDDLKRCQAKLANCEELLRVALRDQFEYLDMPELGIGRRPWKEAALAAREEIKMAEERRVLHIDELVEARKRAAGANKRTADVARQATAWEETCVSAKRQRDENAQRIKSLQAINCEVLKEKSAALVALKQSGIDAAELLAERDAATQLGTDMEGHWHAEHRKLAAVQERVKELVLQVNEARTALASMTEERDESQRWVVEHLNPALELRTENVSLAAVLSAAQERVKELESPDGARVVAIGGEMLTGSEIYARSLEEVKIRHRLQDALASAADKLADKNCRHETVLETARAGRAAALERAHLAGTELALVRSGAQADAGRIRELEAEKNELLNEQGYRAKFKEAVLRGAQLREAVGCTSHDGDEAVMGRIKFLRECERNLHGTGDTIGVLDELKGAQRELSTAQARTKTLEERLVERSVGNSAKDARVAQLEGDCEELRTDLEHRCSAIGDLEAALERERSQPSAEEADHGS